MRAPRFLRLFTAQGRDIARREALSPDTMQASLLFSATVLHRAWPISLLMKDSETNVPIVVDMATWPKSETAAMLESLGFEDDRIATEVPIKATLRGRILEADGRRTFHAHFLAVA